MASCKLQESKKKARRRLCMWCCGVTDCALRFTSEYSFTDLEYFASNSAGLPCLPATFACVRASWFYL